MVVVRHWSMVDLQRLYGLAEHEDDERRLQHQIEIPPPQIDGIGHTNPDPRLQIEGPKNEEDQSRAIVKYDETPIHNLDESMNRAMYRPNRLLRSPGNDIVDVLLAEWTRIGGSSPQPRHKRHKHQPRYATDSEDSEIDFERSRDIGGRYIDAPPRKPKNVHFQRAQVESETDESDNPRPRHRGPRHHILDSDSVSTSTSESESPPPRVPRRDSTSKGRPSMQELGDRYKRPYTNGGGTSPQASRPNSQGGAPPPPPQQQPRPMPPQSPSWNAPQVIGSAGLRPPQPFSPIPLSAPQRIPSSGPYGPQQTYPGSPGTSPNSKGYFPPPPPLGPNGVQQLQVPYPADGSGRRYSDRKGKGGRRRSKDERTFKGDVKRDVKRGIIGAGAVAGLMDILEGLSGI